MTIDNDLINEILKIAYKAVPKKCSLDGTKLIEVHNEMGEFLKIKLLNKAPVSGSVCECKEHRKVPFTLRPALKCTLCGLPLAN